MTKLLWLALAGLFWQALAVDARAADLLSTSDKATYRAAFAAAEQQKWDEALKLAAKAKDQLPAKVLQWMNLTRPGPGRSFQEITQFRRANPGWPSRQTLQAQGERAMPPTLPPTAVIAWFGKDRPVTITGAGQLTRALIAKGQKAHAHDVLRNAWIHLDFDADEELTFLTEFGGLLQREDHAARLDRLLWDDEEEEARRMLVRVEPGAAAVGSVRLAFLSLDPNAEFVLKNLAPDLARDPGLVVAHAAWLRRRGEYDKVISVLDPPGTNIPRPDRLWPEMERAARLALQRGDVSVAYRLARSHGAVEGPSFADGEWLAGWVALRFLEDKQAAYQHFTRLYAGVTSTITRARAAYWAGRAAEETGELALAQNWYEAAAAYPTVYYGQLAAHRIGRPDALTFPPLPSPTKAEADAFGKRELVRIVRMLGEIGESDRTAPFVRKLSESATTPGQRRLLADLARGVDRDDLAVEIAKKARQDGVELITYLYPLRKLPAGEAPEDALILAIIRQESAFLPTAISPAGASGLMQLMPGTAKEVAAKLKLKYSKDKLTNDPNFNIQLGRAYLGGLLDQFSGSYILSIAGYNAGPANVQTWLSDYGDPRDYGVDVVDWVEMIPYSETRNYVQRVMENLQVYRHRLNKDQIALSLDQDLVRKYQP